MTVYYNKKDEIMRSEILQKPKRKKKKKKEVVEVMKREKNGGGRSLNYVIQSNGKVRHKWDEVDGNPPGYWRGRNHKNGSDWKFP